MKINARAPWVVLKWSLLVASLMFWATMCQTLADDGESTTLFVPIVLSSPGANQSFFTSELTLTNRGTRQAEVELFYTAALGAGNGQARIQLAPGRQLVAPDAIEYLKSLGIPIGDANARGGTLAVRFSGLSSRGDAMATVRTTTSTSEGRAGLAYPGIPISIALQGPAYLCGLRQNLTDRSNVAIQHAGAPSDGDVTLRLTVYSGDPNSAGSFTLPDEVLSPGGFKQINSILASQGLSLSNGYVRVERVGGSAPYYAYAVINDQANSDGSFILPMPESSLPVAELTVPVIVENNIFESELALTNFGTQSKTLRLSFVASSIQAPGNAAQIAVNLLPGEQRIFRVTFNI